MSYELSKQASEALSPKDKIALLGGTGFVGSVLLQSLLETPGLSIHELRLASRNAQNPKLIEVAQLTTETENINVVQCNHINGQEVKALTAGMNVVIDLAGLAWQHPGGEPIPKTELLSRELLQNGVSALIMGTAISSEQVLVWTSTSAIDGMFARLSAADQESLRQEVEQLVEELMTKITPLQGSVEEHTQKIDEIIARFNFGAWPKEPGSTQKVSFAHEFSYAYSKLIGEKILEKLSSGNVRALRISDVYGPGQDISPRILNPALPARRVQRYIAAYQSIQNGQTEWIPNNGKNMYGFSKNKRDEITQNSWNDSVFPTHVQDVIEMIVRSAGQINGDKTVYAVNGNKMSNIDLMTQLRDYFQAPVTINPDAPITYVMPQNSGDLKLLNMSAETLIPFSIGLHSWVSEK